KTTDRKLVINTRANDSPPCDAAAGYHVATASPGRSLPPGRSRAEPFPRQHWTSSSGFPLTVLPHRCRGHIVPGPCCAIVWRRADTPASDVPIAAAWAWVRAWLASPCAGRTPASLLPIHRGRGRPV